MRFYIPSLRKWGYGLAVLGACLVCFLFLFTNTGSARSLEAPSPSDLISAVNQLRASRGLNVLEVHPILMQTAQMQADALLASEGAVGHARPNGLSYTDQLILLGFPLAGDLSLGGYRAENIISAHPDMTIQDVISAWLGDDLHANTMLSPYYTHIGAGIAEAMDGTVYYVLDCAMQTPDGKPQDYTPTTGTGGTLEQQDAVIQYIQPVIVATARPDGDVIHEVLYGNALWSIAIAYGVKIEQIQRYNNIQDTTIYTGQKLLVQKGATQPIPTAADTSTPTSPAGRPPTSTASPTTTPDPKLGASTLEVNIDPVHQSGNPGLALFLGGILVLSMLVGGLVTWLGNRT